MRLLFLVATLAAPVLTLRTPIAASAQTGPPTGIVSLASLRGIWRPLLIFALKPDDPQLEIQLRRLQDNAAAVAERNIVVIAIPYQSPAPTPAMLSDDADQTARRQFHVAPGDFAVILLGRDGGEKLRSVKPISIDKLRQTIDTLPMRR